MVKEFPVTLFIYLITRFDYKQEEFGGLQLIKFSVISLQSHIRVERRHSPSKFHVYYVVPCSSSCSLFGVPAYLLFRDCSLHKLQRRINRTKDSDDALALSKLQDTVVH